MAKLTANQEKDAVDIVTDTMYSLDFLDEISKVIFSPSRNEVTVGEFYDQWLASTMATEMKIPFNLGVFVAYLFVGLLVTKENWTGLIPDEDVDNISLDWGLGGVNYSATKKPLKLKEFIRCLRNALGHSDFSFELSNNLQSVVGFHNKVIIVFRDQRDLSNAFEARLTLAQLERLIKKFHSVVHASVEKKYGIEKL